MGYAPLVVFAVAFGSVLLLVVAGFYPSAKQITLAIQPWQTSLSALIGFMAVVMTIGATQQREFDARTERHDNEIIDRVSERQQSLLSTAIELNGVVENEGELEGALEDAVNAVGHHRSGDCRAAVRRMRHVKFTSLEVIEFDNFAKLQFSPEFQWGAASFRREWMKMEVRLNALEPNSVCTGDAGAIQLNSIGVSFKALLRKSHEFADACKREMRLATSDLKYVRK